MAQTSSVTKVSKSVLFSVYNKARASGIEKGRVNRALGIVQAGRARLQSDGSALVQNEDGTTYRATAHGCTCPDWQHRGSKSNSWCKHMVCYGLLARAQQQAPKPAPLVSQQEVDDAINLLYGAA